MMMRCLATFLLVYGVAGLSVKKYSDIKPDDYPQYQANTISQLNDEEGISKYCGAKKEEAVLECSVKFVSQKASIEAKLNKCKDPVTATLRVRVTALNVDWSVDVHAKQEVAIPGFSVSMLGVGAAVYLKTDIYKETKDDTRVKLKLDLKVEFSLGSKTTAVEKNVYDQNLPFDATCTSEEKDKSTGEDTGTIVGVVIAILVILLILVVVFYTWKKKLLCFSPARRSHAPKSGTV